MKTTFFLLSLSITTLLTNAQEVTTFAGSTPGFADGTGIVAQFLNPSGVATDAAGNLYVADQNNNKIRKITPTGEVSTLAGSTQGFADGAGASAQFYNPQGLGTDNSGNVYVADTNNNKIRKITPDGVVTTLAGSTQGFADGTGTTVKFSLPQGVVTDAAGNVYVSDTYNHKIRKITPAGVVSTIAGSTQGFADGTPTIAKFRLPIGIAIDAVGNLYVADSENYKIRKITPSGEVSTLAGSIHGYADGIGSAAQFYYPYGVAIDNSGNVYVGDTYNTKIRKITSGGVVSTLAGSTVGFADGAAAVAQFYSPLGVATDTAGNVYVVDEGNHKIRKINQQLGLAQNNFNLKITVYPNPVATLLNIKLENGCVLDKISITDISGKNNSYPNPKPEHHKHRKPRKRDLLFRGFF